MKLTTHARKRAQQRGISLDALLLVSLFGEETRNKQGCVKFRMTEKARRSIIQLLDKCYNKVVVADENITSLITAYTLSK